MAKEKVTMNYNKLTIEQMVDYVIENDVKDKIDLTAFYEEKAKKVAVGVFDAENKPVMITTRGGKLQQKKKMVEVSGAKHKVYNILKAKRAFYDAFANDIEWTNAPKAKKAETKNDKIANALSRLK